MSEKRYLFAFVGPYRLEDPTALQRRTEHRPAHTQRLMGLLEDGTIQFGGPMLTEDSDPAGPAEEQKPAGSFIIFYATSAAKVREIIEGDLFYTENVWAKEKIRINPVLAQGPGLKL